MAGIGAKSAKYEKKINIGAYGQIFYLYQYLIKVVMRRMDVMFQEAHRRFQIQNILSRTKVIGKKACAVKSFAQSIDKNNRNLLSAD